MFIQSHCLCISKTQYRDLPKQEAFSLGSFVLIPSTQTLTPPCCQHEQAYCPRKMCISDFSLVLRFQPLRLLTIWIADGSHIVGLLLARNGQCSCTNNKTEAGGVRDSSVFSNAGKYPYYTQNYIPQLSALDKKGRGEDRWKAQKGWVIR